MCDGDCGEVDPTTSVPSGWCKGGRIDDNDERCATATVGRSASSSLTGSSPREAVRDEEERVFFS
jgi:hypothetical protein